MLKIHCGSFSTKLTKSGNEIKIDNNDGYIIIDSKLNNVLNSMNFCFNEIKEYFERRGYKIEAL
ncbi:hypothetical protein MEG1DRAFT_04297 [Photorhabdus temperata subsp. temperata Meg1]|uniref:Uncharacterized protein n=1 Tax=Photorhabdus temperata subsp. temperata Meg1 TaxID=1393735 RepID=A0A081RQY4_PHOTE|nr:hypothetical protein MEG1DRAFT_04297 [Photorhabdus temperata subsp. temperata Meg1]